MAALKMTVKFRLKNKIPFSIENLSGTQFRCGVCGKIYFSRDEIDRHLLKEKLNENDKLQFPELDRNMSINIIYTQDIRDLTNPKYPRLKNGDKILIKKNIKG
ncbi:MAG: hypothetical protein ABR980_03925 [Ignavibacteriaceae bacterium]|jgi:hypothetical protein